MSRHILDALIARLAAEPAMIDELLAPTVRIVSGLGKEARSPNSAVDLEHDLAIGLQDLKSIKVLAFFRMKTGYEAITRVEDSSGGMRRLTIRFTVDDFDRIEYLEFGA